MTVPMALRRLAGLMLLWALVPLPFTQIVQAPFLAVAALAGLVRARWPERDLQPGRGAMNLIAVVIVILVLAVGGVGVGPLRPLGHLLLLLSSVQVLAVADRHSFTRALPGIGLVWLVGMSASTHVTIALYFIASAVAAWWVGMRIHLLLVADEVGARAPAGPSLGAAVGGAAAALALGVPVFLAMPRLASPWVTGYGVHSVTGFSSTVDLGGSGPIQESREMAVVVTLPPDEAPRPEWSRLRGTVLDPVGAGSWAPRGVDFDVVHPAGQRVPIARGTLPTAVERLEIEVLRPRRYLFLPEGAVALESPLPFTFDAAGSVVLAARPAGSVTYSVWLAAQPVPRLEQPVARESRLDQRDPELAAVARRVVGERTDPAARATAIESYLQQGFEYSLSRGGGRHSDPVRWFLLEGQSGHCEYFAASMVMLLRYLDVPARMVSGYAGGSVAPGERQVIVRDANAHTWVEVWTGATRGWVTYDPTPQSGVPGLTTRTGVQRLLWAWDWVGLMWDRYVLTFGIGEQIGLLAAVSDLVLRVGVALRWWHVTVLLLVVAGLAAGWWWRPRWRWPDRSRRGPAARLVERLARRLDQVGIVIPRRATVRWIGRAAAQRWPRTTGPIRRLTELAEAELYAPASLAAAEYQDLRRAWADFRRGASQ